MLDGRQDGESGSGGGGGDYGSSSGGGGNDYGSSGGGQRSSGGGQQRSSGVAAVGTKPAQRLWTLTTTFRSKLMQAARHSGSLR